MKPEDKEAILQVVSRFLDEVKESPIIEIQVMGDYASDLEICTNLKFVVEYSLDDKDHYQLEDLFRKQHTWAYGDDSKYVTLIESVRQLEL